MVVCVRSGVGWGGRGGWGVGREGGTPLCMRREKCVRACVPLRAIAPSPNGHVIPLRGPTKPQLVVRCRAALAINTSPLAASPIAGLCCLVGHRLAASARGARENSQIRKLSPWRSTQRVNRRSLSLQSCALDLGAGALEHWLARRLWVGGCWGVPVPRSGSFRKFGRAHPPANTNNFGSGSKGGCGWVGVGRKGGQDLLAPSNSKGPHSPVGTTTSAPTT